MTVKQKFTKYLGLALAAFLIAAIALGVFGILTSLLGIEDKTDIKTDYDSSYNISDSVGILQLDISASAVKIVKGESFIVATDNSEIEVNENGSVLKISEKKRIGVFNSDRLIIISVPEDKVFERVNISAGAGEIKAEILKSCVLNMNLGAGDIVIDEISISERASVNTAAGELIVKSGNINDLDMDLAVGDVNLKTELTGKTEIDCGVGDIDISLPGNADDYSVEIDKGISSAKLNGKEMKDETVYGRGKNIIEIDGGAGDISIETEE